MINLKYLLFIKDGRLESSKYIKLEISTDQLQILNLSEKDLRRSKFFQDVIQKSIRRLGSRILNLIGNMVGNCSVLTNEKNLKRSAEDMQTAASYVYMTERHKLFKSLKHYRLKNVMMDALPSAITKLKTNNCDFVKSTKRELAEILLYV